VNLDPIQNDAMKNELNLKLKFGVYKSNEDSMRNYIGSFSMTQQI